MAYNPTIWKDQIVTDPNKYKITKENGIEEVANIERAPGEIIQEGTQITADKLNNIEQGIKGAADLVNDLAGTGRTGETVKKNADDIGNISAQMADLANEAKSNVGRYQAEFGFEDVIVKGEDPFSIAGWDESIGSTPSAGWDYCTMVGDKIYARCPSASYKMLIYDTVTNTWDESSGSAPSGEWTYPVAVGTKIYVKQNASPYKMWIYDTVTNTWDESSGDTPSSGWYYTVAVGSKIYARQASTPCKVWIYDTVTNTWDTSSGGTPTGGSWSYPVAIENKIYTLQGASPYKMWIYDTDTNTWDESSGGAPSGTCAYLAVIDNKIYTTQGVASYKTWIYDTDTNTWDESSGGTPSGSWSYPISIGDKIYARQTASPYKVWIYSTKTDYSKVVTTKTITPTSIEKWGNLKVNASELDANNSASVDVGISLDSIDKTSGGTPSFAWISPIAIGTKIYAKQNTLPVKMWIYDTLTNTWDESSGGTPSANWGYPALVGTKIYAAQLDAPYRIWIYDTVTNTWDESSGATPSGKWRDANAVGNKIYVKQDSTPYKVWIYDTDTNTWDESSGGTPSESWYYPVVFGDKIYTRQNNSPYKVWIYDTLTNTWDESSGGTPSESWFYPVLVGTKIYAKQGTDPYKIWIYDTINNTWDESSGIVPGGSWGDPVTIGTTIYMRDSVTQKVWMYKNGYKYLIPNQPLANGENLIDLSSIDPKQYPSLATIFNLSRNAVIDPTPKLSNPSWTWKGAEKEVSQTIEKILDMTLTSNVASIILDDNIDKFNNIKVIFTNLVGTSASNANLLIHVNNDISNDYSYGVYKIAYGSTLAGLFSSYQNYFTLEWGIPKAGSMGYKQYLPNITIDIKKGTDNFGCSFDWSYMTISGYQNETNTYKGVGKYAQNNAVNSITFKPSSGQFNVGTRIMVYGYN